MRSTTQTNAVDATVLGRVKRWVLALRAAAF
jgi:hypothetical protein